MTTSQNDEDITRNYLAQCDAMVGADVSELGSLLAPDFTLTHMTGYLQSRNEWLDDIVTGQMTYHSIRNVSIIPAIANESVALIGRSHTHATLWGAEGTWPLQLSVEFARTPGGWIATRTVASTW